MSGKPMCFNGLVLNENGHSLCSDIGSYDIYWISGVKNGQNKHWSGDGKIMIDETFVDEYVNLVDGSAYLLEAGGRCASL